ncbi:MAG: hypothetical protein RBT73_06290 [Spirochaetia bacterium]|jgi:hypothetical protein|nr:hypothetical protein [Spirochaetia bacterium]
MIMWNAELTKRLSCTEKEKAALPGLVTGLLDLADRLRAGGIKSLIGAGPEKDQDILAYGLRMISEGLSSETLEEILAIYLATSTLTGYDFLVQCIYVEAILSIAGGDSRELLLRKLAPYCGAEKAFALLKAQEPLRLAETP